MLGDGVAVDLEQVRPGRLDEGGAAAAGRRCRHVHRDSHLTDMLFVDQFQTAHGEQYLV